MNKKDLKSGMTVKLRNGDVGLVINNFITDNESFMYFNDFDDNLVCRGDFTKFDIVEVYQFNSPVTKLKANSLRTLLDPTNPYMQLLWKRQELSKLSNAERVILENVDKKYKWIARDKSDELFICSDKPKKYSHVWSVEVKSKLGVFPNLFTFVKWEDEQPYNIEELLKGEK